MGYFEKSSETTDTARSQDSKRIWKRDKFTMAVKRDGMESSVQRVADLISKSFTSHEAALQFVLEELDMSQDGNIMEKTFVSHSGIEHSLYNYSTANYNYQNKDILLEVDNACMQLCGLLGMLNKPESFKVEFRLATVDNIMRKYHIGKYSIEGVT